MSMNEWLAQAYGTGGVQAEDIEKQAQADLIQQLAGQQGLDLSQFTTDELQQLAQMLAEQGQTVVPQAPQTQTTVPGQPGQAQQPVVQAPGVAGNEEERLMKEAAEKFQEADFLGRVMAHAYCNELQKIAAAQAEVQAQAEKQAAMEQVKEMLAKHKGKSEKSAQTSPTDKSEKSEMSAKTEKTASDEALQKTIQEQAEKLAAQWLVDNGFAKLNQ